MRQRRQYANPNDWLNHAIEKGQERMDVMPCFQGQCVWPASCRHTELDGKVAICLRTGKAPTTLLAP